MEQYQQKDHSILAEYKEDKYQKGSLRGGRDIYLYLITCEYKIVIS